MPPEAGARSRRRTGRRVVFISDCSGFPRAWVSRLDGIRMQVLLQTGRDHAEAVSWSPDGEWIAVLGAPGGETTRTRVWVVRPDGRGARRVAGVRTGTASFGPWLRDGAVLPLSTSGRRPEETSSTLLDVHTGERRPLGYGARLHRARRQPRRRHGAGAGRRSRPAHRACGQPAQRKGTQPHRAGRSAAAEGRHRSGLLPAGRAGAGAQQSAPRPVRADAAERPESQQLAGLFRRWSPSMRAANSTASPSPPAANGQPCCGTCGPSRCSR